jgi:hypothetical protein
MSILKDINMLNKRGQGLSIKTIIIAVVGLMVLVVLVALLSGRLGGFSKGVGTLGSCEGSCKAFKLISSSQLETACVGGDE